VKTIRLLLASRAALPVGVDIPDKGKDNYESFCRDYCLLPV
jgi:hypothetical protein